MAVEDQDKENAFTDLTDTERKADRLKTPSQQGSAGGELQRKVGKRAEHDGARSGGESVERVRGQDDPDADKKKGDTALFKMQGAG